MVNCAGCSSQATQPFANNVGFRVNDCIT